MDLMLFLCPLPLPFLTIRLAAAVSNVLLLRRLPTPPDYVPGVARVVDRTAMLILGMGLRCCVSSLPERTVVYLLSAVFVGRLLRGLQRRLRQLDQILNQQCRRF